MMVDLNYLPYSDSIEGAQPDEAEITEQIVASMGRVNRKIFDKHRHAVRDAHAKSHGILKGELEVYPDMTGHLRQGIFATVKRFPVIVRLSTAPGDLQSDRSPSLYGMAIKVLGVTGNKILSKDEGHNQDFLLVNHPVMPFGNVAAYWAFQQMMEKLAESSSEPATTEKPSDAASMLPASLRAVSAVPYSHILGESFHSMAALRFGSYVAKLSAAPLSNSVRSLTGTSVPDTDSALRDLVVDFFRNNSAEYELRAQLLTDLEQMPIEDASVLWPENLSPHQPIGKLTFPAQDPYSPGRRVYADDVLSFNPWHCIEEHRPLGSIMRIRIKAYEMSSSFRHQMNAQPRLEPKDINELPL
jgi:Catalase